MPIRKIRNAKSFDKCRACNHSYISHTDFNRQNCLCQYVVDGNCRCLEFLPSDNLEFLEMRYGKLVINLGNKSNEDLSSQ